MDDQEREQQQAIHDALTDVLPLDDDHLLTGWVVIWESTTLAAAESTAGSFYGPSGMTTWRSLGLIEWVRRFCLRPDDDEDVDG